MLSPPRVSLLPGSGVAPVSRAVLGARSQPGPFSPYTAASVPVICFAHLVFGKAQFGKINVMQKGPSGPSPEPSYGSL